MKLIPLVALILAGMAALAWVWAHHDCEPMVIGAVIETAGCSR